MADCLYDIARSRLALGTDHRSTFLDPAQRLSQVSRTADKRNLELVGEVLSVIRKVAAEGVSMVIVTHEMNFAREVADRILFMEDGVIVEDAPPEEFFEHPKNDRIRQFIRKVEER